MKTSKAITFFKENKKTILIASAVVAVVVVVVVLIKKIKAAVIKKNLKDDATTLTGTDLTPGLHIGALAAAILEACGGPGTDEEAIYGALNQLRTPADWEYMKSAWSATFAETLKSWQMSLLRLQGISQSLTATLSNELNRKELQKCRDILSAKGITPDF